MPITGSETGVFHENKSRMFAARDVCLLEYAGRRRRKR